MFPFYTEEEWSSFMYMTHAKSHTRKKKNQDSGTREPVFILRELTAMRQTIYTPRGPDGCAFMVFLLLSSQSGTTLSLIEAPEGNE